ncbi:MAG TPA: hypothetical protein VGN57_15595 [Pirellulaceae bacterium]|nr:hypothetical protein [Pirellulaceae bacterium]
MQADVFVARERMTAKFEVFLEDLYFFQGVEPDAENRFAAAELERAADAHADFLAERFVIRRTDGSAYQATSAKRVSGEIPAEGVAMGDLMKTSFVYEIEYAVDAPPEFLTFEQRFVGESFRVPSNVALRIWQEGGTDPVAVQTLSPRKPFSLHLDWSAPAPAATASVEAWDAWMESRRQSTLGITSYSSTYAFLYIEPAEVRLEVLVPLLSLEDDEWRAARSDPERLTPEEQTAARDAVIQRLGGKILMTIDGEPREPVVDRVDFYGIDFSDFAMQAPQSTVGAASARVGIILRYPCDGLPRTVELGWKLFLRDLHAVEAVVFAPDDSYDVEFSSVDPEQVYRWENPSPEEADLGEPDRIAAPPMPSAGKWTIVMIAGGALVAAGLFAGRAVRRRSVPLGVAAGVALAGAGVGLFAWAYASGRAETLRARPAPEEALAVVQKLQLQIYDAFRLPDEEARYERLDASLSGDLVREAYLEISDRLRMQEQGGALLRIDQVTPIEGRILAPSGRSDDPRAFVAEGRWTVSGRVEHWGHVHTRTNAYDGQLLVEPVDGYWKIARLDLLSDERIESRTTLREF